jgi:HSP20 family molecular chaperone IbpA
MSEVKKEASLPRYRPNSDIVELEDGFHIYMDMPGVRKEDLTVDVDGDQVTVTAKTFYGADPANGSHRKYSHLEFGGGEYQRSFTLSDNVDRANISAKLENGVLNLSLPKSEALKPRKIEITAG